MIHEELISIVPVHETREESKQARDEREHRPEIKIQAKAFLYPKWAHNHLTAGGGHNSRQRAEYWNRSESPVHCSARTSSVGIYSSFSEDYSQSRQRNQRERRKRKKSLVHFWRAISVIRLSHALTCTPASYVA